MTKILSLVEIFVPSGPLIGTQFNSLWKRKRKKKQRKDKKKGQEK